MFEKFESPICMETMPERVKATLDDIEKSSYDELLELDHFSYGTPDGECDTDCWRITVDSVLGVITFYDWIITGDKVIFNTICRPKIDLQRVMDKAQKKVEVA